MNREEELTDILRKVEWRQMDSTVAFDRILRLFNVVGQSEQLKCSLCNDRKIIEGNSWDDFKACPKCNE